MGRVVPIMTTVNTYTEAARPHPVAMRGSGRRWCAAVSSATAAPLFRLKSSLAEAAHRAHRPDRPRTDPVPFDPDSCLQAVNRLRLYAGTEEPMPA